MYNFFRFQIERTKVHAPGSLEDLVTNLLKNWEKELGHKIDIQQWRTMDISCFRMTTNGGLWKGIAELAVLGPYNAFIGDCEYYDPSRIDAATSQAAIRHALSGGFAIEVLQVFSPPPNIIFKWRHWGYMDGSMNCPMRGGKRLHLPGNGAKVEIFGVSRAHLNEGYQIQEIEHFIRPETMFEQMGGKTFKEKE
jgi:hypothetical protein